MFAGPIPNESPLQQILAGYANMDSNLRIARDHKIYRASTLHIRGYDKVFGSDRLIRLCWQSLGGLVLLVTERRFSFTLRHELETAACVRSESTPTFEGAYRALGCCRHDTYRALGISHTGVDRVLRCCI